VQVDRRANLATPLCISKLHIQQTRRMQSRSASASTANSRKSAYSEASHLRQLRLLLNRLQSKYSISQWLLAREIDVCEWPASQRSCPCAEFMGADAGDHLRSACEVSCQWDQLTATGGRWSLPAAVTAAAVAAATGVMIVVGTTGTAVAAAAAAGTGTRICATTCATSHRA